MSTFDDYSEVSPPRSSEEALEWARPQLTDAERDDRLFQAFLQKFSKDVEAGLSLEKMLSMARELTEKTRAGLSDNMIESQIIPRLLGKEIDRGNRPSPESEAWWEEVKRPRVKPDPSWDIDYVSTLTELALLRKLAERGRTVVEGDELHEDVLRSLFRLAVPLRAGRTAEYLLSSEDPDGKGVWIELFVEDLIFEDANGTVREDLLSKPEPRLARSNLGLILLIAAALIALVVFLMVR